MEVHDAGEDCLPQTASVLAVCAHPDDERFGLGAALSWWAEREVKLSLLCFTHGEASSLGTAAGDLHRLREKELALAADELGVSTVRLLEHPDGRLAEEPIEELSAELRQAVNWQVRVSCWCSTKVGTPDTPIMFVPPRSPLRSPASRASRYWRGLCLSRWPRSSTTSSIRASSGAGPRTSTWSSRSTGFASIGPSRTMPASPVRTPSCGVGSSCKAMMRHSAGLTVECRRGHGLPTARTGSVGRRRSLRRVDEGKGWLPDRQAGP